MKIFTPLASLFIFGLLSFPVVTHATVTNSAPPVAFPIFLKVGFSAVLEFEEALTRVVLGDGQSFQVERLDRSLVLRTLVAYATSNLFVYFKAGAPKLFVLTASEDAVPTYFKKIELPPELRPPLPKAPPQSSAKIGVSHVVSAKFDVKKDYLTVEVRIAADASRRLRPAWNLVRLKNGSSVQAPHSLWAERKDIQKDSSVRARFVFAKPNVPRDLSGMSLIVPVEGQVTPLSLIFKGVAG